MGVTKNTQTEENIKRMAAHAFPDREMLYCKELTEGMCNVAYLIGFSDGRKSILKIAAADNRGYMTNEINMMDAEVKAMELVRGKIAAKVAGIELFDKERRLCSGNYFFMEFIEGENYFFMMDSFTEGEKEEISYQIGQNVRQIAVIEGEAFKQLGDEVNSFGTQYELMRHMLSNVIGDADRKSVEYFISGDKLLRMLERDKEIFAEVTKPSLVHYDLWEGNVFVKDRKVVGLIDWERALFGDPLMEDRFRRHTRNDAFLRGYGKDKLSESEMQRIYWYDILLYLTMMTEGQYREYEDDGQYKWVAPLYEASLKKLTEYGAS